MDTCRYSDYQLYNQLKYLESLFDASRAAQKLELENDKRVKQQLDLKSAYVSDGHKEVFESSKAIVSEIIRSSAYNWVRPSLWTAVFGSKDKKKSRKMIAAAAAAGAGAGSAMVTN